MTNHQVIPINTISISPADFEENAEAQAKEDADFIEAALLEFAKKGHEDFQRGEPAERLKFYRENTLPEDQDFIMDIDSYLKDRADGLAPLLPSEVLTLQNEKLLAEWQTQATEAAQGGGELPPKPELEEVPPFWPGLMPAGPGRAGEYPESIVRYHAFDYANLIRNEVRREA